MVSFFFTPALLENINRQRSTRDIPEKIVISFFSSLIRGSKMRNGKEDEACGPLITACNYPNYWRLANYAVIPRHVTIFSLFLSYFSGLYKVLVVMLNQDTA